MPQAECSTLAIANVFRAVADVGLWQILSQKSFWSDERNFLAPLMRFTSGDVISFHPKSITDLRSGAENRRSGKEVRRSAFARFLALFDFRLLQQYRHFSDMGRCSI
jgi:hypothetical protein